ncbi:MAG TPA: hypothetical protein P5228_02505 [Bacteroidales bacterium]|nr:hypothetical protein [Bacteroidales bacterium]HRZ48570.1 hypothetical protein [Bacteroidales bacterium]
MKQTGTSRSPAKGIYPLVVMCMMLFLGSCAPDLEFGKFKAPEWNPNLAVPLATAKLTIDDLLKKTGEIDYLKQNPDSSLSLYHQSQVLSEYAGGLITFGDQTKDTTVNVLFPVSLPPGDSITLSYFFKQKFVNSNGDEVDSIRFKGGTFNLSIESMMPHNAKVIMTTPYITKGGIPFRRVFDLIYTGTLPVISSVQLNLSEYTFVYDNVTNENNLFYFFDVRLYGDNNPSPGPFSIKLNVSQHDLEYSALFGLIKTRSMALLSDTISLNIFEKSLGGNFWVNDPRIGIHIRNSFGIPIDLSIDPLIGTSTITPPYTVQLSGSGLPVPFSLNAPNYTQIGQHVNTDLYLDKTNSNLAAFLNLLPQKIIYGVEGVLNPSGLPQNFVLDSSHFEVNLEVEIPLEGYASGFTLQDTVEFELNEEIEFIDWVMFRIFAESTFPVEAAVQVVFLDSNFTALDSLFAAPTALIPGAAPGPPPSYKSTVPNLKTIDISLPASRIANINGKTRYLQLGGTINTGGGGNQVVKIYTDNYLKMSVGAQAKLKVDPNNL